MVKDAQHGYSWCSLLSPMIAFHIGPNTLSILQSFSVHQTTFPLVWRSAVWERIGTLGRASPTTWTLPACRYIFPIPNCGRKSNQRAPCILWSFFFTKCLSIWLSVEPQINLSLNSVWKAFRNIPFPESFYYERNNFLLLFLAFSFNTPQRGPVPCLQFAIKSRPWQTSRHLFGTERFL